MTKITIIGESVPKEKKKIEFIYAIEEQVNVPSVKKSNFSALEWGNIELIYKGYDGNFDIMFAYDDDRSRGVLYLGYFNDGIV